MCQCICPYIYRAFLLPWSMGGGGLGEGAVKYMQKTMRLCSGIVIIHEAVKMELSK